MVAINSTSMATIATDATVGGGNTILTEYTSIMTTPVSPVTLQQVSDWSRVARLLLVVGLAVIGSVGNVYMISAIMIEDHLKKRG